jgi:hypothetical protein
VVALPPSPVDGRGGIVIGASTLYLIVNIFGGRDRIAIDLVTMGGKAAAPIHVVTNDIVVRQSALTGLPG